MGQKKYYIILGIIVFLIIGILALDVYIFKFGKFWEKQTPPQKITLPTPSPNLSITLQQADSVMKKIAATIIQPELISKTSTTTNITPKDSESSDTTISFASSWKDSKGVVFQINASFKNNSTILNSYDLVIGIPKEMIQILNSSSATKFVTGYINPSIKPVLKCANTNKKIPEFILCNAPLEENNGVKPTLQVVYPL